MDNDSIFETEEDSSGAEASESDESSAQSEIEYPPLLNGKYFRVKDSSKTGQIIATCVTCEGQTEGTSNELGKSCDYKGSHRSRTNFTTHLKRKHKELYEQYQTENPAKRRKVKFEDFEFVDLNEKQDATNKNIINYLSANFYPTDIVDDKFVNIISGVNCQLEVISGDELKLSIDDKANKIREELKTILKDTSYITITVTGVEINSIAYLITVCYWLDNADLSRQSALLACNIVNTSSLDSDYLLEVVKPVLNDYGIQLNQVSKILVNNLFYYDTAFENFINNPDPDDLHCSTNNYFFDDYHDPKKIDYLIVNIQQSDSDDNLPIDSSIHYETSCFWLEDFLNILAEHGKLHFHYQVFSKLNKIWNLAKSNPSQISSSYQSIDVPKLDHIKSLYNPINELTLTGRKLNSVTKRLNLGITFTDEEIHYLEDVRDYLKILTDAIEGLDEDEHSYYGNVTPTLYAMKERLIQLNFLELNNCHSTIIKNFGSKFAKYLELSEQNSSLMAACFNPLYKHIWLSSNSREHVKNICRIKLSDVDSDTVPRPIEIAAVPEKRRFIFMRSCAEPSNKDYQDLESLTYFNEPPSDNRQLEKFPTIKKIFVQYNTELCSPIHVESMLKRTNIFNLLHSSFHTNQLINQYSIINSIQPIISDEGSSEE